jgi:hypothetical protein
LIWFVPCRLELAFLRVADHLTRALSGGDGKRYAVTHGQSRLDVNRSLQPAFPVKGVSEPGRGLRLIVQPLLIQCEALL